MMLNKDFREFIELLNQNNVRYLVIGGYAVAIHGHPRYTKDIDIWIYPEKKNAEKIINTLDAFGFSSLGLCSDDFMTPGDIIQLGFPPNRIDILTDIAGVDFEACYASKVQLDVDGLLVNFIDLKNLKKNKKATGRLQDLADLENLK